MSANIRPHRWPWVIGILLLVGSGLGAGLVLNQNSGSNNTTKEDKTAAPPVIICLGFVDAEAGVASLYPVLPGPVEWVAKEGPISEGEPIVKMESELADLKLQEAKAELDAAERLFAQAQKLLPVQYKLKVAQQMSAIRAARHTRAAAYQDYLIKEKLFLEIPPLVSAEVKQAHYELVKKLDAAVAVEEAKLREAELADPFIDLSRAEADLAAKRARVKQAEFALDKTVLKAPSDGTVLRVFVAKGEIPSPKGPAVHFVADGARIVRAEVLQEWASRVSLGQEVEIEDDTYASLKWTGKIIRLSDWYTHRRSILIEPFMMNDVRTLECLVEITSKDSNLRIGQRVRVKIKTGS